MGEFYLHGGLIDKEQWMAAILRLREESTVVQEVPLDVLKRQWITAFEAAVLQRAQGAKSVGLLFSGGVDSTLIGFVLHKHKIPFTCYTVGFKDPKTKDPEDILEARKVAQHYGWQHKESVLELEEMEPYLQLTSRILGETANPVTAGVGAVVVAAAEMARADGVHVLFGGLGSEEIFAGYHRHDKAHLKGELHEEAWAGMIRMYQRDMIRDSKIAEALHISVPTPFMDPEVIKLAMRMPEDLKIKDGHKKYILREMAVAYGLAAEFAFRPKRAAQYGSRMHKAIARLAKRHELSEEEYVAQLANQTH
jgi:asparagine synthetase B (glutamine-hydrolysing)